MLQGKYKTNLYCWVLYLVKFLVGLFCRPLTTHLEHGGELTSIWRTQSTTPDGTSSTFWEKVGFHWQVSSMHTYTLRFSNSLVLYTVHAHTYSTCWDYTQHMESINLPLFRAILKFMGKKKFNYVGNNCLNKWNKCLKLVRLGRELSSYSEPVAFYLK